MGSMAVAWAGSSPALAQSPTPPPGDRFAARFDGWSFGVGGGYSAFHANPQAASILSKGPNFNTSAELEGDKGFAVFEAGREFRHGNFILGLFGDVQLGSASENFASSSRKGPIRSELNLGSGGSITGHAGFVVDESAHFYGLFGWAFNHYDATLNVTDVSTRYSGEASGWLDGPTVGVGAEMLVPNHPNLSLKGEYRFTRFNGPTVKADHGSLSTTVDYGRISSQGFRVVLSFKLPAN
jgi:opacity protein-like surface antigen